jgi:uncharacterized protein (TIGR02646 family)
MVKIEPYFDNAPLELWEQVSQKRYKKEKSNPDGKSKIELMLFQKSKHDFDGDIYAAPFVKDQLKTIFQNKCGFCETNTHAGAYKDVEHYRFKKHYYWLGYEWTNLLLACQICNRHKSTQFPIENETHRVKNHPIHSSGAFDTVHCHILSPRLCAEKPLLLHPAIHDPAKHLCFLPNGTVEGISANGRSSIQIYDLNRDELVKKRFAIISKIIKFIIDMYLIGIEGLSGIEKETWMTTILKAAINHLKSKIEDKTTQYIAFRQAIFNHFEPFVVDNSIGIDMPDKEMMRQVVRQLFQ